MTIKELIDKLSKLPLDSIPFTYLTEGRCTYIAPLVDKQLISIQINTESPLHSHLPSAPFNPRPTCPPSLSNNILPNHLSLMFGWLDKYILSLLKKKNQ